MSDYVKIGKIKSSTASFDSIVNQIIKSVTEKTGDIYIHLNMHNFTVLKNNPEILEKYSTNCRVYFEGIGMKIAAKITNQGWNNDTNGTDLFPILFKELSKKKKRVFLLGASQLVLNKTITNISNQFPGIEIVGYHHGYINNYDKIYLSEQISNSSPDMLVLAMGMKNEADFIVSNYDLISVGAIWCVGGLFDFISGNLARAPKIVRKVRLEWLFRFLLEPKAKFKRTIVTPLQFFSSVILSHYFKKEAIL